MSMISPPYLELGFYSAEIQDREAFMNLYNALVQTGATPAKEARVHQGENIQYKPFSFINDNVLVSLDLEKISLESILDNSDSRLIQVMMDKIFSSESVDVPGILTYLSISNKASQIDHHPIAIWLDGTIFDPIPEYEARRKKLGKQIYKQFLRLIQRASPSYGAITIEYALECPTDLRDDPRSLAFMDFYISGNYLNYRKISKLKEIFKEAYIENVNDGLYISCTSYFNPENKQTDFNRHIEVAKLVSSPQIVSSGLS